MIETEAEIDILLICQTSACPSTRSLDFFTSLLFSGYGFSLSGLIQTLDLQHNPYADNSKIYDSSWSSILNTVQAFIRGILGQSNGNSVQVLWSWTSQIHLIIIAKFKWPKLNSTVFSPQSLFPHISPFNFVEMSFFQLLRQILYFSSLILLSHILYLCDQ